MHDLRTVAHEIRWPKKDANGYRENLLTIWHVDPERDGSDDSCGWFMRSRHCDQAKLAKIESQFAFEWSHGVPFGWFDKNGEPNYSCQAITLGMFRIAANIHFGHRSRKADRFLNRNLHNILHFAESNCDSLYTFITQHYGRDELDTVESRSREAAQIVYPWICRASRPWWQHPRWHFWHWKIQFHPWHQFRRRWLDRCDVCGKRGFPPGVSAIGNWDGNRIWHSTCDSAYQSKVQQEHSR